MQDQADFYHSSYARVRARNQEEAGRIDAQYQKDGKLSLAWIFCAFNSLQ